MIFYIATDADGRKHALTVSTEAKKLDKDFIEIDQPNDKASIKILLQESFDALFDLQGQINSLKHDASIAPITIVTEEISESVQEDTPLGSFEDRFEDNRAAERAKLIGVSRNVEALTSDIMQLEGWPLGQCALAVASRFTELGEVTRP